MDHGEVIAAGTAASSFATPLENEATRLALTRARSIHGMRPASVLRRIIRWNSAMISRASTRVGTPASIAETVTASAFVSKSRPMVIRRAMVLADGILSTEAALLAHGSLKRRQPIELTG
ncbi:hypothetical protein XH79_41475 [Bradyrhizobium sp. CCBAU 45389]|nr:hypothetical protein [Bradyrhizobium sp. CCBAU 45389]